MTMYLYDDLKRERVVHAQQVECSVMGCSQRVKRAARGWRPSPEYRCPEHGIYVTPTTFSFERPPKQQPPRQNILWTDPSDQDLLTSILPAKRECRMHHEQSEDAVTWSVFRGLDRAGLVGPMITELLQVAAHEAHIIWWSSAAHDPELKSTDRGVWSCLDDARRAFETRPAQGSEPDLMVLTNETLFIIEAKVGATNVVPCSKPEVVRDSYVHGVAGDDKHFSRVFRSSFDEIAVDAKLYELMRFWLLGTWMADHLERKFCLVSLLSRNDRRECEGDARLPAITERFPQHVRFHDGQRFELLIWEGIHDWCVTGASTSPEAGEVARYLADKTAGYTTVKRNATDTQRLRRAFAIKPSLPGTR